MRIAIDINDAILAKLREKAVRSRRPICQVVEGVLKLGLAVKPTSANPAQKTYPVGIKTAFRGVRMNQCYDQLESSSIQMR
jgi:hypothetical protein